MFKQAQSLLDFLMEVMPDIVGPDFSIVLKKDVDNPNAKKLYGLWSDSENKISERKFKRPPSMTESDVKELEVAGFIEIQGRDIKVTSKGVSVIKEMILNDNSSPLDKEASSGGLKKIASKDEDRCITPISFSANPVFKHWYKSINREK